MTSEIARIRDIYQARAARAGSLYSLFNPSELYLLQRREEATLALLRAEGLSSLAGLNLLEIGCGRGGRLAECMRWGAAPEQLWGVDLMPEFIAEARQLLPGTQLSVGDAGALEFPAAQFDIVMQSTVFTSVLDAELRARIAAEMRRVARPGGLLLWYDFRYPNPRNPDVRPIGADEIKQYFPGCRIALRSLTLLPPLARRLAPLSFGLCRALECLPPLRSHYLALIRTP